MPRKRNLVILVSLPEHTGTMGTVADHVREMAPDIAVHLVLDERRPWKRRLLALRPTLVFSPVYLHHRVGPKRAKVFQGAELSKSDEYKRLEAAGVPVPRWTLLREGEQPDLDGLGPIVVRKPDFGARGAYVEIMRREQVKWERMEDPVRPGKLDLIVQEFVYTGAQDGSLPRLDSVWATALCDPGRVPARGVDLARRVRRRCQRHRACARRNRDSD
ncbi:MAG: hypothetical protein V3T86_11060 [Planctomycetota bacterium]